MSAIQLLPLRAEEIPANWHWLGPVLEPAVKPDRKNTLKDVYTALVSGETTAWLANAGPSRAVVVTGLGTVVGTDTPACWIEYIAGQGVLRVARDAIEQFEDWARSIGCAEMRVQGRKWGRVLKDYTPTGDEDNELRKVL
jgi:hypothetical protein